VCVCVYAYHCIYVVIYNKKNFPAKDQRSWWCGGSVQARCKQMFGLVIPPKYLYCTWIGLFYDYSSGDGDGDGDGEGYIMSRVT